MTSIKHEPSSASTTFTPLSHFAQVFDDTLVKSIHERHVAGVTLALPDGDNADVLTAVNAVLDALEPALRIHTISMILITASILVSDATTNDQKIIHLTRPFSHSVPWA